MNKFIFAILLFALQGNAQNVTTVKSNIYGSKIYPCSFAQPHQNVYMRSYCIKNKLSKKLEWLPTLSDYGFEIQKYPAGTIIGGRLEFQVSRLWEADALIGYNFARHQDFGVHDDESGGGFGLSAGMRRAAFERYLRNVFIGGRNDLWAMTIDWKDFDASGVTVVDSGQSQYMVIQPSVEIGRHFYLNHFDFDLSTSFGFEVNTFVRGSTTGQGSIARIHVIIKPKKILNSIKRTRRVIAAL